MSQLSQTSLFRFQELPAELGSLLINANADPVLLGHRLEACSLVNDRSEHADLCLLGSSDMTGDGVAVRNSEPH